MLSNATVTATDNSPGMLSSNVVGISYTVVPLLLLFIHTVFNTILHVSDEFRNHTAFRLIFYVGVLNCIQLVCHVYSGIVTIWPSIITHLPYLNRIVGSTVNAAWMSLFPLSLVISVYRLLIIRKIADAKSTFPSLVKCGILLSFTYCFAFWICQLTIAGFLYDPNSWFWSYTNQQGSDILAQIEIITCVPLVTITFIVYIAIGVSVYKMNHIVKKIRNTEIELIIHAGILFLVMTTVIAFSHYHDYIFPDSMWTVFAIDLYWMMYCGLNPLLYLAFSRKFRMSFLHFIHAAPPGRSATVVSTMGMRSTP